MDSSEPFKWRHFKPEIILLNVRWYLRYSLSYQDLEEMMLERGLNVDQTTIFRWVQAYSPEMDKHCRPYLSPTNDSWRVDETYIKIKGVWKYLYRAVDSEGNTLDFMLNDKHNAKAAKRFLKKVLNASHTIAPRVITVEKNATYPPAIDEFKARRSSTENVRNPAGQVLEQHRRPRSSVYQTTRQTGSRIWLIQHG